MPNPFHFRATIDRLWRRSTEHNPGCIRVKALDTIVRELFAPNPRARLNYRIYLSTDPFDVARHKLRDLYDRVDLLQTSPEGAGAPRPCPAQGAALLQGEEPLEEDDDPW